MLIFSRYFHFSLFFLFTSFPNISIACPQSFLSDSILSDSVVSDSAFVRFAKEHLGEKWTETMGKKWEERITEATKHWNEKDAGDFLSFLQSRIGTEDTIKRIQSTSYFHTTNYKKLMERVSLYEEYIGEQGVTMRLKNSLGGFDRGETSEIRDVIKYIADQVGMEATKQLMTESLRGISDARLSELKRVVNYVESYIGVEATKERIKKDLQAFSRAKLSELKKVVQFVESYIGVEATKERIKKDLHGLSKLTVDKLKKWETVWGAELLKTRIEAVSFQYLLKLYGN